ncbi:hypothetical protein DFH07DRAFT_959650 [Mycena maculata]|uniref:Uncharacterized protein n=1 Tax=Mycena maculata TaxID=230809 RepID=A0AAD7J1J8_9AGAR|nr:hypothetical protein DFH07DRAFT_959650 [Mycena maculata]
MSSPLSSPLSSAAITPSARESADKELDEATVSYNQALENFNKTNGSEPDPILLATQLGTLEQETVLPDKAAEMEEDLRSDLIQRDTDISAQLTVDAYFHQDLQQLEGDVETYYHSSLVHDIVDSDDMDVDNVNDSSKPAPSVSISTPVGVKSDEKTNEKLGETDMVLDDGFVESQIDTKPKKPTITSLSEEESLLNEKVESMNNFLTREENLGESVRSGIIQAISIINLQRVSITSQIEKLRAMKH